MRKPRDIPEREVNSSPPNMRAVARSLRHKPSANLCSVAADLLESAAAQLDLYAEALAFADAQKPNQRAAPQSAEDADVSGMDPFYYALREMEKRERLAKRKAKQ